MTLEGLLNDDIIYDIREAEIGGITVYVGENDQGKRGYVICREKYQKVGRDVYGRKIYLRDGWEL